MYSVCAVDRHALLCAYSTAVNVVGIGIQYSTEHKYQDQRLRIAPLTIWLLINVNDTKRVSRDLHLFHSSFPALEGTRYMAGHDT